MKKFLLTLSLLLSFGLSFSAVAAQTDGVEAPDLDEMASLEDVEGLQSIYDRTFSVDFEAMMATPDTDFESLDMSAMMRVISIQGMTFDSEDNAQAYFDDMITQMDQSLEEDAEGVGEIEINDLDGLGVDAISITMDMPDVGVGATINVFVDGTDVFQVMVMDADVANTADKADEVTQFVLDAEVQSDELVLNADGTSTGGVFDRMPTANDEIVGDLTGTMDSEIYVVAE